MEAILNIEAIIVLERVANGIPRVLETAFNGPSEKVRQTGKLQSSAKVLVEVLLDTCAAELKTELHVVFVDLRGKAVYELIVTVHAVPRDGGVRSWLREKGTGPRGRKRDQNDGQTRICSTRPGARWPGNRGRRSRRIARRAEPDRAGVKALILGKESLREAVPAVAQFVEFRRGEHMHVRERNKLDARRGHGVKTRKLPARSAQRQRKSLRAVPEEIAPGYIVILVKGVIDLRDHAG